MRLTDNNHELTSQALERRELETHPVVVRAREAYKNDLIGASLSESEPVALCRRQITYSTGLIGDAHEQGISEADVRAALGSGRRERRWDGCLIVRDWFLGLEVQLDPSGQFGMSLRRVG